MMNRGIIASFCLHSLLLLLMVLGVPEMLRKDLPPVPPVMVVEILPVTGKTNVRASKPEQKVDSDQKKPDKKAEPRPKEEAKKEEKKPEPMPSPEKKEEPKKEEKKKEEVKKEEPKKEEKAKPKDDFAEILKNVAKSANQKQGADDTNPNKAINTEFDPNQQMSVSEVDYIRQKVKTCWNVVTFSGMKDSRNMAVDLRITLAADGTVMDVKPESMMKMSDPLYRVAAETAMRAVRKCSPFDRLPPEKYESWKEMTMTFDPSQMLY